MLAKTTLYLDFSAPSRAKDSGEAGPEECSVASEG